MSYTKLSTTRLEHPTPLLLADPGPWARAKASPWPHAGLSPQGLRSKGWATVLASLPDLTSLWRKRQLFRRLAELPRQQVTSPYSCMIFIISHMAVGQVRSQESGKQSPVQVLAETHWLKGQGAMGSRAVFGATPPSSMAT